MAVKLFDSKDRDESHRKLEEVLASGLHPAAECREDPNDRERPFQVWNGPHERVWNGPHSS
jgi:hypothetical protein